MPEPAESRVRILLVDDNIDHVQLAMRALRSEASWKIETARLGTEAIARVRDEPFDLVLLDYRLPDLTGIEVLHRLRKDRPDIAVLLMTSQGSEEVAMDALASGAAGYIVKTTDFGRRLAFEVREWVAENRGA